MQKNLTIILLILLFSCGGDSSTNPSSIDYYTDDQQFIDDLATANGIINKETITERITTVKIDTGSIKYYRIEKLNLGSMGLDSIPPSIGTLDSLTILYLNDNNIQNITESICDVYGQLDTLNIYNNKICTPTIPECIEENTTITEFYGNQGCDILPDEGDRDFIMDLINENWADTTTEFIDILKNSYTEWEDYWENGSLVSRITEIRYDNKAITKIPNSIADLDSLRWLELQNNQIEIIPGYIGSLKKLQYFTIFQNNITELPPQIGYLSSLEVLKISENNLENIHQNIGELNNLNLLWLSENQITTLPESMCNILENLNIEIYIDNNLLCPGNNHDCFNDLITNSTQPDCEE